jgi:hypothetical protein
MKGNMMNPSRILRRLALAAFLFGGLGLFSAFGQTFAANGTTTLSVTVGAEAAIAINTASTNFTTPGGGLFADFTGTTNFTYKIRTAQSTGAGHISLQITTDFTGAGGPKVASPPSTGDALTYACTTASGTACTGPVTASTTAPTTVATFAADAHSIKAGDAGSVEWTLTNDPVYKTGTYTATATFTIAIP